MAQEAVVEEKPRRGRPPTPKGVEISVNEDIRVLSEHCPHFGSVPVVHETWGGGWKCLVWGNRPCKHVAWDNEREVSIANVPEMKSCDEPDRLEAARTEKRGKRA